MMALNPAFVAPKNESDEEDDYMSDNLVAAVEHVKPGIHRTSASARRMKLEREQEELKEEQKRSARRNIEAEKREEAMAKPLSEESKGYAMLAKMGFKPGMNIGKQREDAIKEPIGIELKTGRTGLGLEADQKRRAAERLAQELEITKKRQKFQHVLLGQYRNRKRDHADNRQIMSDFRKSQSVCRDLDLRADTNAEPTCSKFWPPENDTSKVAHLHTSDLSDSIAESNGNPTEIRSKREIFDKLLGRTNEADEDDEEEEVDPNFWLPKLTAYLRETHFYCVWCAVKFEDLEDLQQNCPGDTRLAHGDE